jgi:hypothetical protein
MWQSAWQSVAEDMAYGVVYGVELYAFLLINELNDAARSQAHLEDVPRIEKLV